MQTKGGRYTIDIGGRRYSGRAEATIRPAQATPETGVNQDASGYVTVSPQLAEIELSFDRGAFAWREGMLLETIDVTFKETDAGHTHLLTRANWSGRPEINSATGEVRGMKVASDQYRRV
ncbi:MAG: hypothetical protein DI565_13920 [Ancylobacter novellus]|uniref:Phage tail protein n=1 Tax=Ancylobacter novellus TaxID=921 RepID=A0A2W5KFP0_ANCNO|nr:MAG: hypothetical protein DI565_13920 [Ancylobacter novellus]